MLSFKQWLEDYSSKSPEQIISDMLDKGYKKFAIETELKRLGLKVSPQDIGNVITKKHLSSTLNRNSPTNFSKQADESDDFYTYQSDEDDSIRYPSIDFNHGVGGGKRIFRSSRIG